MSDPLVRMLAALPSADPNAARADRLRARCRATLARQRLPRTRRRGPNRFWGPLAASVGGIYLIEVMRSVLDVYATR
jgi:hypothetical protein